MSEGMSAVSVGGGTGEGGDPGVFKTNHLWCCQEGGETEPTGRAWGTTGKGRDTAASLKLGGQEEKKGEN